MQRPYAFIVSLAALVVTPALVLAGPDDLADRLETQRVSVEYDGIELSAVIEHLREQFALNLHVSWRALERIGIRRDHPVDLRLRDVPLGTVLDLIVRDLSKPFEEVVSVVDDGIVQITTDDFMPLATSLRTYDITDLIESGYAVRRFANTPVLGLEVTGREFVGGEAEEPAMEHGGGHGFGGGGGGGGSVFGDPAEESHRLSRMERVARIVDLITENVDPESWIINGGNVGSIQVIESTLLVRHSPNAHRQVEAFLALLRDAQPRPLTADVAIVRLQAERAARLRGTIGEAFPRLPAELVAELLTSPDAQGVLLRATSSGFNGRRFWLSALTQTDTITGMTAIVGDHAHGYQPTTGTTSDGLEIILLPLLPPEGDRLTLDVQMAWIPPAEIDRESVVFAVDAETGSVDRVSRRLRTVSTTASTTLGDTIALTIPQTLNESASSQPWEDWLIVRVRE